MCKKKEITEAFISLSPLSLLLRLQVAYPNPVVWIFSNPQKGLGVGVSS
jgi:hypothetical protein